MKILTKLYFICERAYSARPWFVQKKVIFPGNSIPCRFDTQRGCWFDKQTCWFQTHACTIDTTGTVILLHCLSNPIVCYWNYGQTTTFYRSKVIFSEKNHFRWSAGRLPFKILIFIDYSTDFAPFLDLNSNLY
jgi:hypothetical protein